MTCIFPHQRLSWNTPLLPPLVDLLIRKSTTTTPLSLDHLLLVTPTRQSGRRLHEALTEAAHQRGTGIFPPIIVTPDALIRMACGSQSTASRPLVLATWSALLQEQTHSQEFSSHFQALLPNNDIPLDPQWSLQLARQLERIQSQITPYGLDFSQIANRTHGTAMDAERWAMLAKLETRYQQRLQEMGKSCPQQSRIQAAQTPILPENIKSLILAATPDPSPLVLRLLQSAQETGLAIEVIQYGPDLEAAWDSHGLPCAEYWNQANLDLSPNHIPTLTYNSNELATRVRHQLVDDSHADPRAVGIPDAALLPLIERDLEDHQIASYNPSGYPLSQSETGRVLLALQDFCLQTSFYPTWNLLRHPAFFREVLARRQRLSNAHGETLLREIDALESSHLCHSLQSLCSILKRQPATKFPMMNRAVEILLEWQQAVESTPPEQALESILLQFFGERFLVPANPQDRVLIEELQSISEVFEQLRELRQHYPNIPNTTLHSLLGGLLRETMLYRERASNAVDLQGWLEMLWESAPHLILAGMHDQALPSHIQGDAFLPEQLRRHIGMASNEDRAAIDVYLLHALLATRRQSGQVDILVARWDMDGQTIKPSRLLFQIADDQALLQQIQKLIHEPPPPASPPRQPARQVPLSPPAHARKKLSVTAFKTWLKNPFDFYLQHILGWKNWDHRKQEMNAADIGILVHHAMEQCIPAFYQQNLDVDSMQQLLEKEAFSRLQESYGHPLHFLTELQWENLRQRLYRCAEIEFTHRQQGWENLYVEQKLTFTIGDWQIEGRVDRIDHNKKQGLYRIIDYKTGSTANQVFKKTHSRTPPPLLPEIHFYTPDGKGVLAEHRWLDLQLPLYAHAVQQLGISGDIEACHFAITSQIGSIQIEPPLTMPSPLVESAMQCATAIVHSISQNHFWSDQESESFSHWFPDGVAQTLDLNAIRFPSTDTDQTSPL